jgi:cation transport regulator ChaC
MQKKRIAILAWGSLLWDDNPQFHKHHHGWRKGGPVLKIEFSQIASPAEDGLALVIDGKHGAECRVAYTHSRRAHVEDAICDLQSREEPRGRTSDTFFLKETNAKDVIQTRLRKFEPGRCGAGFEPSSGQIHPRTSSSRNSVHSA